MRRITEVRNVVRFIRVCGKITSTWPIDPSSSKSEKILREFLWWISFVNVIGLIVPLIFGAYHYRYQLGLVTKSLSELTALCEVFFNLILCKMQRKRLLKLLSEVTKTVMNADKNDRLIYQKYIDRYLPFMVWIGTSYFLTAVAFSCGPLIMETNLPADAWYPFPIDSSIIKYAIYLSQVIAILQTGLCLTVDFMVGMMLWYSSAGLEILEGRIEKLVADSHLSKCIEDHQKIISFARETNYAVRYLILKGNATMALAAIFGAFPLIHYDSILVVSQFILMIAGGLLRLYVTAWPADDLSEMSEKLGDTIYRSCWVGGSTRLQKSVLFVIQRCQKPLVISVSGFLPALTLIFYANFVSGTLSYFVTLRAVLGE